MYNKILVLTINSKRSTIKELEAAIENATNETNKNIARQKLRA